MQKGEWALVTGASSGIGRAFATQLAQRGLNLYLVALEDSDLLGLSKQLEDKFHVTALYQELDLSEVASIQKIRRDVENKGLHISILINSAGFGYFGDFVSMTATQIEKMVKVNVISLAQLCHLFLPKMKARGSGVIINIASIAGHLPYPYAAVYAGTKSCVHSFTKAIWAENREKNIKIISLNPGYTKTNFDKVTTEPASVHLFPGEDPYDIAEKTLRALPQVQCTRFTKAIHPFKVFAARFLPIKVFAGLLRYLMNRKNK